MKNLLTWYIITYLLPADISLFHYKVQSYLNGHDQYILLHYSKGKKNKTLKGVSLLMNLLFILYNADMANIIDCIVHQFADDTQTIAQPWHKSLHMIPFSKKSCRLCSDSDAIIS